ncbi:cupin domain-containing protein [Kiritimatiellota bacterium B12222]|nr:cupin domain-containing protein [Kiritimatiellota bacterium B12222]
MMSENCFKPLVRYVDETEPLSCPYGQVKRVITGGEYPAANVHVVTVSCGGEHFHRAYDEVYYVLSGSGQLSLDGQHHVLRPGAVVVIPAGVVHALKADTTEDLTFIILGLPGMSIDSPNAMPLKPEPR